MLIKLQKQSKAKNKSERYFSFITQNAISEAWLINQSELFLTNIYGDYFQAVQKAMLHNTNALP